MNSAPAAVPATWALFAEMADFANLTILRNAIFAKRIKKRCSVLTPCAWAEKSNERKMVIINKHSHTKRHTAKRKSTFLSTLSLVLAVLMMLSVSIAGIPTISALKCSYFTHQEKIYIDLTEFTGWENDGAVIRVYTYYGNSDDNWNVENNKDDSACNTSECYQNAIVPSSVVDHVYSFNISGNEVGYVKVLRMNPDLSTAWNNTGFVYNKDRSGSANCIKITGWDNTASWTTYSATGGTDYYEVTASPDSTITGNSNLYTIDATFYDYYTDGEIQRGWGNINYEESHGYWEPYTKLNNKIASASNDVPYPMYFGNFFDKNNGYTGEGSSNMVNFFNLVNNSARLGGTHKSVVGLTGPNLVNGELYYAANGGGNGTKKVPFFDKSFLQSNKVGSVVNTKFPMRKEVSNGITTYAFNSEGPTAKSAGDSVWFNTARDTISYGTGNAKGSKDALYYYSNPKAASGYGFFPFDSTRGADKEAYDFGFGMRVDVKFNLGADDSSHIGQIKGTNGSYDDQKFTFTGDDDVWVYVDGKLILDLGGDHQKASGSINFHSKTVEVTTGTNTVNNATRNTSFTLDNYGDPTAEHTLTMFYVERGMVESNLSFDFNFAPVSNQLIAEKQVNTTELNDGIKNVYALKNADQFNFTSDALNGKSYTYAHTASNGTRTGVGLTVNDSSFKLRDKDTATFADQLTVGTTVNVAESFPSDNVFTYGKTSWVVVDTNDNNSVVAQSAATATQSLNSSFVFKTNKTGTFDPTKLKLTYTNTPDKANAVIKKNVIDSNSIDVSDSKSFTATVSLSFDKGATYNTYPLKYSVAGTAAEQTMSNGQVTLQEGKDITIKNLPVGTRIKVQENAASLDGYTDTTGEVVMEVTASGVTQTITNKQPDSGEVTAVITGTKYLDNSLFRNGELFEYKLEGVAKFSGEGSNYKDTSSVSQTISNTNSNGVFTFTGDYLKYTEPGIYRYIVTEGGNNGGHDGKDFRKIEDTANRKFQKYLVTVTVSKNADFSLSAVTKTVPVSTTAEVTASSFNGTVAPIVFYNEQTKGTVTVNKTDQTNSPVKDVTFGIYKVTNAMIDDLDRMNVEQQYDAIKALSPVTTVNSNADGIAYFDNLNIFEDESSSVFQNYRIIEISGPANYNINKTVMKVVFPEKKGAKWSYDLEFSYINGKAINPNTGYISPIAAIRTIGIGLVLGSLIAAAVYLLRKKKVLVRYKRKH